MKKLMIITLLLVFNQCIKSQECEFKKEIVKDVLSDKSLKNFFKNGNDIVVVNSNCRILNFKFLEKKILFLENHQKFSIKFVKYKRVDKTINVTLNYNNKNIIHLLKYKIVNNKLVSLNREILFHKTPKKH